MLPTPVQDHRGLYPIIRNLHYLNETTLLVCYFLYFGFMLVFTIIIIDIILTLFAN